MRLAVYGTLRKGQGNHHCLNGATYIGTCRALGWTMVSLGGFPAVQETWDEDEEPIGSIVVEIYECPPDVVARCNRLEGYDPDSSNNSFYDRTRAETELGDAHIYTMHNILEDNYDRIESGDWVQYVGQKRSAYAA